MSTIQEMKDAIATASTVNRLEEVVADARKVVPFEIPAPSAQAPRLTSPSSKVFTGSAEEMVEKARGFNAQLNPVDRATAAGRAYQAEMDQAFKKNSTLRDDFEHEMLIGTDGKVLGNQKAPTFAEAQAATRRSQTLLFKGTLFDSSDAVARNVVNAAIADVGDEGAKQALQHALDGITGVLDAEELATRCIKATKVSKAHAAVFRKAVEIRGCEQFSATLLEAVGELRSAKLATKGELGLAEKIEAALERQRAKSNPNPSLAKMREEIHDVAAEIVDAVTQRVDVDRVIQRILESFVEGSEAKKVLHNAFDDEGRRRLFANLGSFRKTYASGQANRAGQNLYGWLYEATLFNKTVMAQETEVFSSRLRKALEDTGITISDPVTHFDVHVPKTVGSAVELQATDHLSHVTLTRGGKSTKVVAAAGEHKGITGIKKGEEQLHKLPGRYAKKTIRADNILYKMGQDLHLEIESALKGLGLNPKEIDAVVAKLKTQPGATQYQRVVIYPPDTAAGIGADVIDPGTLIRRVAHDVPRDQMASLYGALAPWFNLLPRKP